MGGREISWVISYKKLLEAIILREGFVAEIVKTSQKCIIISKIIEEPRNRATSLT